MEFIWVVQTLGANGIVHKTFLVKGQDVEQVGKRFSEFVTKEKKAGEPILFDGESLSIEPTEWSGDICEI